LMVLWCDRCQRTDSPGGPRPDCRVAL